jgi:hypothetical protein
VNDPHQFWPALLSRCINAGTGCDVLAIPHNPNFSAGNMFAPEDPATMTPAQIGAVYALRAQVEPLIETYQHKGASECFNSSAFGAPDELCPFHVLNQPALCNGDGSALPGGVVQCAARLDFTRYILEQGLAEAQRYGVNPYQFGVIASTDTHSALPGNTTEANYQGHHGATDADPRTRITDNPANNPGGLAAAWAVENSRDAIFEALRRRETFGTSGPRIAVRLFGGWNYPSTMCGDPAMLANAYAGGVPMGGTLAPRAAGAGAPKFVVAASRDAVQLQHVQIIKGWVTADGQMHDQIFEVAGSAMNNASVDTATCTTNGPGADTLCGVWTDPSFDPALRAFYYARVIENPSCSHAAYECNSLPAGETRPAQCKFPGVTTVQNRAWTSPIWYAPGT